MKRNYLLAISLILSGCSIQTNSNREVMARLDALQVELAAKPAQPRWAVANKREIDSAITQWSMARQEDAKKSESLTPEMQEKLVHYDSLQGELMRMQMKLMRNNFPGPYGHESIETNADYAALSKRVAEAKEPVAEIIQRRDRLSSELRNQYKADDLIAEYAKDRFDLVVDSSDAGFSRSGVLYQEGGEVTDITEGVLKLFREKTGR
jgi:hypothetical protein